MEGLTLRKLLIFLGFLILPAVAGAQGIPFAVNPPAPNAQIYVCTAPAVGANPCTNQVTIYANVGLTTPITQPAQVGPTGNYTFFYTPVGGALQVQITGRADQIIPGGGGGSGGGLSDPGSNGIVYRNALNTTAVAVAANFPTLNQSTTGNAATSTALAGTPTLCTTGQAPTGILASGNAIGCAPLGGLSGLTVNGILYGATSTTVASPTPPTVNGTYDCLYSVTASIAVAPACPLVGLSGRAVTGTTATDTILYSDNNNVIRHEESVSNAVTLPTPTALGNPNFFTVIKNATTGAATTVTVTPTTLTINGGASLVMPDHSQCSIYLDPAAPTTNWSSTCEDALGAINGVILSSLGTGLLYNTTVTGIPTIATAAQVNSVIQTLTGCNTATNVYTPQAADCVAPSGGGGNTTSTSLTTNTLPKANGANSIINSLFTDTGTSSQYAGTGTFTLGPSAGNGGAAFGTQLLLTNTNSGGTKWGQLGNGNWYTVAVPFFRPNDSGAGANGILDVMSNGSTVASPVQSWTDICSTDITNDPVNWQCVDMTSQTTYVTMGSKQGGTGPVLPMFLNPQGGNITIGGVGAGTPYSLYVQQGGGNLGIVGYEDIHSNSAPSNPGANFGRLYFNGTNLVCLNSAGGNCNEVPSLAYPLTVSSVTSGGIPYFSSTAVQASSGLLPTGDFVLGGGAGGSPTATFSIVPVANGGTGIATQTSNVIYKGNGTGVEVVSSMTDNATTVTSTDTGGYVAPVFVSSGTTAGFVDYPQGTTSAAVAPCNTATSWCVQAATAMTAGVETLLGTRAQGLLFGVGSSSTIQDGNSGDAGHSAVVSTSTATSIGSTSLCSTANCPVGTYRISAYIDVTTACTTTGSYLVSIIYTDDTTVSKTIVMPLIGTGVTATLLGPTANSSSLAESATTNFGQGSMILRSTGAASINYSTTATACGTGGPGLGKLYLTAEPIQ